MLGDCAAAVPVMTTALGCLFAEPAKKSYDMGVAARFVRNCTLSVSVHRRAGPVHIRADYLSLAGNQQRRHEAVLDLARVTRVQDAAFDVHVIGIDPDFRVRVFDRLLEVRDGLFLELGFSNRSVQAVAQSMCAIKRRDRASLPIYFRSSIEWTILEARP